MGCDKKSIKDILTAFKSGETKKEKTTKSQEPQVLKELVQLVRRQNALLNTPQNLLPPGYLKSINSEMIDEEVSRFLQNLFPGLNRITEKSQEYEEGKLIINDILQFIRENDLGKKIYDEYRERHHRYVFIENVQRTNTRAQANNLNGSQGVETPQQLMFDETVFFIWRIMM